MINAIMPARGRTQQTVDLIPRLLKTSGLVYDEEWKLTIVVDRDEELANTLSELKYDYVQCEKPRYGYWHALCQGYEYNGGSIIVNLANDLLPGLDWLKTALETYQRLSLRFDTQELIIGFNDGIHKGNHAAHMFMPVKLLRRYFDVELFPVWYHHEYGDTEIATRAQQDRLFFVDPFAVLYHNHRYICAPDDNVYNEGTKNSWYDRRLFEAREKSQWQQSSLW